jgi:hypothetical protein
MRLTITEFESQCTASPPGHRGYVGWIINSTPDSDKECKCVGGAFIHVLFNEGGDVRYAARRRSSPYFTATLAQITPRNNWLCYISRMHAESRTERSVFTTTHCAPDGILCASSVFRHRLMLVLCRFGGLLLWMIIQKIAGCAAPPH